jgi:hypothetical protein
MTREECLSEILIAARRLSELKAGYRRLGEAAYRMGRHRGLVEKLARKIREYEATLVELCEAVANKYGDA